MAASTVEAKYGSNNQSITCTITSLGSTAARQSTAVDNTTNLFLEALVFVTVKTSASALSTVPFVNVYAYGTCDGGSNYTDGATGTDGAITLVNPPNLKLIGVISTPATSTTYKAGPFSVAAAFGGVLPDHWGIVVENQTGQTLDASVGAAIYQGVQNQIV
jgi:hypothetical protein